MSSQKITSKCEDGATILRLVVPDRVKNLTSCDIFVDDHNLVFSSDNIIYRYYTASRIDTKDLKAFIVELDTKKREYAVRLPYLPEEITETRIHSDLSPWQFSCHPPINILEMSRGIDSCTFLADGKPQKFDKKFSYGFACRFQDDTSLLTENLRQISHITNPSKLSPIQRCYQRETDERRDFCRDQYKINFVELQVPDGLENPFQFAFNPSDAELDTKQKYTLSVIAKKQCHVSDAEQPFVDCGLIELLLAICYDIRSTQNETTCESAWTRSILSTMLSYFEPVANLRKVVEIFLRRSLIYPLYRNYDLSRLCIKDAMDALQKGPKWIQKQLLITYDLFLTSDDNRSVFNKFFIEDYVRYLNNVDDNHLKTLSQNLKNVQLNFTKKDIRLDLSDIETELLKELIDDIHLGDSDDSDDDEEEQGEESSDESSSGNENAD